MFDRQILHQPPSSIANCEFPQGSSATQPRTAGSFSVFWALISSSVRNDLFLSVDSGACKGPHKRCPWCSAMNRNVMVN